MWLSAVITVFQNMGRTADAIWRSSSENQAVVGPFCAFRQTLSPFCLPSWDILPLLRGGLPALERWASALRRIPAWQRTHGCMSCGEQAAPVHWRALRVTLLPLGAETMLLWYQILPLLTMHQHNPMKSQTGKPKEFCRVSHSRDQDSAEHSWGKGDPFLTHLFLYEAVASPVSWGKTVELAGVLQCGVSC